MKQRYDNTVCHDYVNCEEAANILTERFGHYHPQVVNVLARRGSIEGAVKFGTRWLIPREWCYTHLKKAVSCKSITVKEMTSMLFGMPNQINREW